MHTTTDSIDSKLVAAGFLKAKEDKKGGFIYPITPHGVMTLLSNYIKQQKLEDTISITFLNEVIQDGSKELYNFSIGPFPNIISFVVPRDPKESKPKTESQTRLDSSSSSSDSDSKIEKEKSARYQEIAAELCATIPEIVRRAGKPLNFVVWSSHEHLSLVAECKGNFYFLDSCGYYFQRFPVESNVKGLIAGQNAFHIESQIQADDLTCGSYCVEFVKKLTERFLLSSGGQQDIFNRYMRQFFINEDGSEFYVSLAMQGSSQRVYGLVPTELLMYFQSFKFLTNIQGYLMKEAEEKLKQLEEKKTDLKIILEKQNMEISALRQQFNPTEYSRISLEVDELKRQLLKRIPILEKDGSNQKEVDAAKTLKEKIRSEYASKLQSLQTTPEELAKKSQKEVDKLIQKIKEISLEQNNIEKKLEQIRAVQLEISRKLPKETKIENQPIIKAREDHLKELCGTLFAVVAVPPQLVDFNTKQMGIFTETKSFFSKLSILNLGKPESQTAFMQYVGESILNLLDPSYRRTSLGNFTIDASGIQSSTLKTLKLLNSTDHLSREERYALFCGIYKGLTENHDLMRQFIEHIKKTSKLSENFLELCRHSQHNSVIKMFIKAINSPAQHSMSEHKK